MGKRGEKTQADVLAVLRRRGGPMSAYEVLGALRERHPKIAPPTIYRALAGDHDALRQRLAALNPNARQQTAEETTADDMFSLAAFDPAGKPPDVRAWLRFEVSDGDGHGHDHDHHHDHSHDVNIHGATTAFCFSADRPIAPADLEAAISALQASFGADLLRMKGLVEISDPPDTPCVLHVVGHVASPLRRLDAWPEGIDKTRVVMIVAGPGRHAAAKMLARFLPQLRGPGLGAGGRPAAQARAGS